jgi:hypothetical protein
VHPTGQKSKKYPQVEGLPVALSKRHAKIRREGYYRPPNRVSSIPSRGGGPVAGPNLCKQGRRIWVASVRGVESHGASTAENDP